MDDFISRKEHEEFTKRIDAENERQNKRINLLEEEFQKLNALTVAVEKMAVSMENMLAEQKEQGKRLKALEMEPAEAHRQIKMSIISTITGTVIGAVVGALIMLL